MPTITSVFVFTDEPTDWDSIEQAEAILYYLAGRIRLDSSSPVGVEYAGPIGARRMFGQNLTLNRGRTSEGEGAFSALCQTTHLEDAAVSLRPPE